MKVICLMLLSSRIQSSGIIWQSSYPTVVVLINASGTKTWNDDNDKDGKRPDKITVRLYANGNWSAS